MALSMERWRNQVAIVTGASSGIGASIAEKLVEVGVKVVGVARRKERVEELSKQLEGKPGKLYAVAGDVSKEEDILAAFKWIKENVGPVHILINNAGVNRVTTLMEGETKLWKETLDINVMGLCMCTREAVKDMKANNVAGHIVHINSVAGHNVLNLPMINVYPATKFAVTALTETLRLELNSVGSKIKITSVSPGAVATEILEASMKASNRDVAPEMRDLLISKAHLQSEDVANAVMYSLSTPPHVQIHELTIKPVGEEF